MSVFPVSLTAVVSEWFKDEQIASVATWPDLTNKFFDKFYQPSCTGRNGKARKSQSPVDYRFEN